MKITRITPFDIINDLEIAGYDPLRVKLKKGLIVSVRENFDVSEEEVYVPRGWCSDGASIPKWFQPLIGEAVNRDFMIPAIVHDYLCVTKNKSQTFTHSLFRELLKMEGVPFWKRQAMFIAVSAWNKKKNPQWK